MKNYFYIILFLIGCKEEFTRPDYSRVEGDYFGYAIYASKYRHDTISMNVIVLPFGANYIMNFELNGMQEVKIETCIPYEFPHEYLFFSYLDNDYFF